MVDIVVVEDIHWADEATLDLLRYLSRRLRGAAVLLIATYRDDGLAAADPLRVALGDLGSQRCARRVGLMPLSQDAAMALADAPGEEALREALGIVIGLGAQPAARIIRQRLRTLGARSIPAGPHAATRERPFGLTWREGEVLDLICSQHTNAEIATKLFISAKTVDHHVSAILAKLGVPTRAAARHAAQLRLAGPQTSRRSA